MGDRRRPRPQVLIAELEVERARRTGRMVLTGSLGSRPLFGFEVADPDRPGRRLVRLFLEVPEDA